MTFSSMRLTALSVLFLLSLCTPVLAQNESVGADWSVRADYLDACCCQPSCPCLFGAAPTLGFCEGVTLIELEKAHFGGVNLDGVKVVAVYRGGTWIKFYVAEEASEEQTQAAIKLLPTFEGFFAIDDVVEVANVPITVEHVGDTVHLSLPNTQVSLEVMRGKNGKPIKVANLPWPGFPAPPLNDHTQYKTIVLKHDGEERSFDHWGTNGFTANIEVTANADH
jgi:hypothetical protein